MLVTAAGGTEIPLELTRQLKGCGLSRGTTYPPLSTASALQKLTKHKVLKGGIILTYANSSGEHLALRGLQDHSVGREPSSYPPDDPPVEVVPARLHPLLGSLALVFTPALSLKLDNLADTLVSRASNTYPTSCSSSCVTTVKFVTLAIQTLSRPQEPPRRWLADSSDTISSIAYNFGSPSITFGHSGLPSVSSGFILASQGSNGDNGRQYHGAEDHRGEGEQAMSQRGPAPQPPALSLSRDVHSPSPSYRAFGQDGPSHQHHRNPSNTSMANIDGNHTQTGSKTSGVHNILNPSEPQERLPTPAPSLPMPSAQRDSPQAAMRMGQYPVDGSPSRFYGYQTQSMPGSRTTTPVPATSSMVHPASENESPITNHPFPMAMSRRMLTPRSPRPSSMGRGTTRHMEGQQLPSMPSHVQRTPTPSHNTSPLSGPPTFPGPRPFSGPLHGQGASLPPPPSQPNTGMAAPLSQPLLGQRLPPPVTAGPLQSGPLTREPAGRPVSHPSFPSPPTTTTGPVSGGLTAAYLLQDRSRLAVDGRQHMITITPSVGEEILVPVDIHQGSRQADAKRQRNAGASARFRQRKREIERNRERDLQRLEVESREWNKKMQDLTTERDYFRSEAERLRKIVAGIPEFSKLADPAQPTPVSSPPSVPSFSVENSPRMGPLPPPQPQSQPPLSHQLSNPYTHSRTRSHPDNTHSSPYDESLTLERPRRRRRTDTEPSPTPGAYPHNTPAPMAIPQPAFGMAHSPHLPPPRLPPLRGLDQPQSTTTPPPASNGPHAVPLTLQSPPDGAYPPYPPAPAPRPEIGWAISQRGLLEGAHRHPLQGSHGYPESLRRPVEQWRHEPHSNRPAA
ncbi:hypothetical protein QBC32DRAFT_369358 [Pseudoneurospora amorphoporcata]|uniref:BZIP domain-containing protein n=1 Tax=Pseudoneurospora amorphoporcata TaxID=241081 RepID=A0AAN6SHV3_9PEZI|nr:hypothetical protein QBC32DRAFT_369358 [Pseudoneurospora amorphoporcata]